MSRVSSFNAPRTFGVEGFIEFIRGDCSEVFPENSSLADLIEYWVWQGNGVLKCFGDFEILLKTIPLIVDEWHRNPAILHHYGNAKVPAFERHVTSAFGSDDVPHAVFSRDHFVAAVYIQQDETLSR